MPKIPEKRSLVTHLCFILLFCFGFYLFIWHPYRTPLADFRVYYEAAQRLSQGQNIYAHLYEVQQFDGRFFKQYYFYPPFLAYVLSFFVSIDYEVLKFLWCGLNFAALIGAVVLLAALKLDGPWAILKPWTRFVVLFFFAVCFEPIYWGVRLGQVNNLVLLLLCAYLFCWQKGKYFNSGACLALAALIKVSPLFLLVLPLVFRRWAVFKGFISVCVLAVLSLCFVPFAVYGDFLSPFGQVFAGTLERHYVFNFALDKAILGILGLDHYSALRWLVRAAVLIAFLCLILRFRKREAGGELGAQGVAVCAMIMLAPTLWAHHLTWAFIPLYLLSATPQAAAACPWKRPVLCLGLYLVLTQTLVIAVLLFKQEPQWIHYAALLPSLVLVTLSACLWRVR